MKSGLIFRPLTPKKAFIGESVKSSYRTVQICSTDAISEKSSGNTLLHAAEKLEYWELLKISNVLITELNDIN